MSRDTSGTELEHGRGPRDGRRRWRSLSVWTAVARVVVTVATVVGIVVAVRAVSLRQVAEALRDANVFLLLLTLPLLLLNFAFRSARFAELLGMPPDPHRPVRRREFFASVLLNHAANNVLPLRAGDFIRTRDFVSRGYSVVVVAVTQLVEKLIEGTALVACVSPVIWSLLAHERKLWFILSIAIASPLLLWGVRRVSGAFVEMRAGTPKLGAREVVRSFAWSTAADLMDVGLIFLCAESLGIHASLSRCLTVYGAVNLAIAVPSTPGHIGALEAGASLALIATGVPRHEAVAFALLYRVVQWIPVTAGGAIVLVLRGRAPLVGARP